MYLGWYDPDKKRPPAQKLQDAIARYTQKNGRTPPVALVNPLDGEQIGEDALGDTQIRRVAHVAPNTFYVGEED